MDIFTELSKSLMPGTRVIRVNGWEEAEKYSMPRDCEVMMLDADPESDFIYMKKIDANGNEKFQRYKITEAPVVKFDPDKYITVEDFKNYQEENRKFQEDILDAINSLK